MHDAEGRCIAMNLFTDKVTHPTSDELEALFRAVCRHIEFNHPKVVLTDFDRFCIAVELESLGTVKVVELSNGGRYAWVENNSLQVAEGYYFCEMVGDDGIDTLEAFPATELAYSI